MRERKKLNSDIRNLFWCYIKNLKYCMLIDENEQNLKKVFTFINKIM